MRTLNINDIPNGFDKFRIVLRPNNHSSSMVLDVMYEDRIFFKLLSLGFKHFCSFVIEQSQIPKDFVEKDLTYVELMQQMWKFNLRQGQGSTFMHSSWY